MSGPLRLTRPTRRLLFAALFLALAFPLLPRLLPHEPLAKRFPTSTALYDAEKRLLRLTLAADQQYRLWTPLERIAPELIEAVLLYEDRRFRWHPGVDPLALARAAFDTYLRGGRRVGGSTLTMQLARRLHRLDTRTPAGKLEQIVRAVLLELTFTKAEILEAYLNLAPYGGNIEGVGAASLIHFGKRADALTTSEAIALAVTPQNPSRRRPTAANAEFVQAFTLLARIWAERRGTTPEQAGLALPAAARGSLPFHAPHFVDAMLAANDGATQIDSTLELGLQRLIERHLRAYVKRQQRLGIRNAAALLVDTRDMGIKAAVGSADFFDASIAGQVNGLQAKRSPGSALKPFIYALALDQGLLHPLTVLKDAPQSFGAYSPENFDGRFSGPLTATEALNRSRNVPAIALAARLGNPSLYDFLRAAGISRLAPESHYGLALVLGGAEVTMEELAKLYAMLANRGMLRELRSRPSDIEDKGIRLLSEEAAFVTLDMLRQNPRPDIALANRDAAKLSVQWKTGTSHGFRDAWTAGSFGPYVLVVWLGNFDNSPNPALVGIQAAAPLFFELVDSIAAARPGLQAPAWRQPPNLARIEVCAASGDLPNSQCPQHASTWFIPGKSPIRVSSLHRAVTIDLETGFVACPPHRPGRTRTEVFELWSSDMLQVFRQAGLPRRTPPPLTPGCTTAEAYAEGISPTITSPLRGVSYALRIGRPEQHAIALTASAGADATQIFWFADDHYIGKASRGRSLSWAPPGPGRYALRAVDDAGRSDTRQLIVSATP
jgi:penicillin-binding protein 1C